MNSNCVLGPILCIEQFDVVMQNFLTMIRFACVNCKNKDGILGWFNDLCTEIHFNDEEEYINLFEHSRLQIEEVLTTPFGACDLDDVNRRYMHHIVANKISINEYNMRELLIGKLKAWKLYLNSVDTQNKDFKRVCNMINALDIFPNRDIDFDELSNEYAIIYDIQSEIEEYSRNIA